MSKKLLLKISGMHCASCAMNIDGELEDTKGVAKVNTSYAKQQTEVIYDEKLVDQDKIIEAIKTAGYIANPA